MNEQPLANESMSDYTQELEASFRKIQEGDIITGTILAADEAGVTVDLGYYAEGFIRAEDYSDDPTFSIQTDVPVGESIKATVLATDDGEGNILLSHKEASHIISWDILKQYLEEQTVLTVKISEIAKGGAVAYVEGIRGFIPASRLSLDYIDNLDEWLHREINVRITEADSTHHKLILSARELLKEARTEEEGRLISNLEPGLVTEGIVETIQPYGAFVRLNNGVSGLLHISQISHKRIGHPSSVLKEGQTITVKIIAIKEGKISLSMKALDDLAAEEIHEEKIAIPESETIGTSLGSLFKNLSL